ncbi:MAG: hypothetical protein LBU90_03790 [Bacteroidales bacterium]|jgi:DNA repair exonuclease SbcCD ATPase subunit|nr:hypothetical protein [Bacteroidales bacterium]
MDEKFKDKTQYSGRFTPEIKTTFNEIAEDNPDFTTKEIVELLCDFYQRNAKENINLNFELQQAQRTESELCEKLQSLENQVQELQVENANLVDAAASGADNADAEIQSLRAQVSELEAKAGADIVRIAALMEENAKVQEMANANAQKLTKMTLACAQPERGKYLVEFGDVAREIMDLTIARLREKLNKPDLSASVLLTDLFVKYTKTRNHFGSFPTMVTNEEIKIIMKKYE